MQAKKKKNVFFLQRDREGEGGPFSDKEKTSQYLNSGMGKEVSPSCCGKRRSERGVSSPNYENPNYSVRRELAVQAQ